MKFNPRQLEGINEHLNENVLVSAAAGSGKTRVLVERIINLITDKEKKVSLSDIVVMTFTNKATNEMKGRIKQRLDELLLENPNDEKLIAESALIQNAEICTIDAFCKKILDENYNALDDFDPSYRIADEKELSILYDDILYDLLEEKYGDESYKDFFDSYYVKNEDEIKRILIRGLYFLLSVPNPKKYVRDCLDKFDEESKKYFNQYKEKAIKDLENVLTPLKKIDKVIELVDDIINFFISEKKTNKTLSKLQELSVYLKNDFSTKYSAIKDENIKALDAESLDKLFELLNNKNLPDTNGLRADAFKEEVVELLKPFLAVFYDEDKKKASYKPIKTCRFLASAKDDYILNENERSLLKLLQTFYEKVEVAKRNKNIIAISDAESLALSILYDEDGKSISEAAKKIADKYAYIFVDEYQDTNVMQELVVSAISDGYKKKNVFIVGDIKQSIYGFRNAEPKLFANKYKKYLSDDNEGLVVTLSTNYRSKENILNFINYMFSKTMFNEYGSIEYAKNDMLGIPTDEEKEEQKKKWINTFTFDEKVELHALCRIDEKNDNIFPLKRDEKIEMEARYIAKLVKELVEKGAEYKDIVILLRSVKDKAKVYTEILSSEGIPSFAELKTGFYSRLEIKLMMDVLNVIDNPLQDICLASVLMSPIYLVTNDELAFIRYIHKNTINGHRKVVHDENSYLYDGIKYIAENDISDKSEKFTIDIEGLKEKINKFLDDFKKLEFRARYLSISDLINYIYSEMNVYRIMASMKDGKIRTANLDILYSNSKAFESTSYVGLFNFIRFVQKIIERKDDSGLAKVYDEKDNIVRVMSIHGSKGLEFPIVILADTAKEYNMNDKKEKAQYDIDIGVGLDYINPSQNYSIDGVKKSLIIDKIFDKTIQEELRMLYVALTRPMQKLIITGAISSKEMYRELREKENIILNNDAPDLANEEKRKEYIEKVKEDKSFLKLLVDFAPFGSDSFVCKIIDVDEKEKEKYSNIDIDILKLCDKSSINANKELLDKNLADDYKFSNLRELKPKMSVTEIKEDAKSAMNIRNMQKFNEKNLLESELYYDDPDLGREIETDKQRVDGTELGNAYHRYMNFYDFKNKRDGVYYCNKRDTAEIEINEEKINKFLLSIVGQKMTKAFNNGNLYREHKFMKFNDENEVIVQGIIDAFMLEKDDNGNEYIVLVDYKTDGLSKSENICMDKNTKSIEKYKEDLRKILVENYHVQLEKYADALKELTGLEVLEKYIYSFALDEAILL